MRRSLALLIFILATYFSTALARHHRIRHNHARHKRQHSASYLPEKYVLDDEGVGGGETGDWGPWSAPSECSRSCGGGVAHQWRVCQTLRPDGAEACTGGHKRYFSCNILDCPEADSDYRADQCSEFNSVPFEERHYEWVPYVKAPNKCELNCMPRGERFYYRHKRKVVDGTRCEEEKLDICVDGKCLPVGCDNVLGSEAREDACRECGGDSSSCNTVTGVLEDNNLQVGYNDILLIPAGATNILIHEVDKSNNYLAIRNESGHYYLNGNWRIDFPRSLKFAGTTFHYERKPHGFYAPEKVFALGPTTESIFIVLLYQATNPGVRYEYSIPKGVALQKDPDSYSWIPDEFSECSTTCGGGVRSRNVSCARRKDLAVADNALCDPANEPARDQPCNNEPCPASWSVGEWGPCSESCRTDPDAGGGGFRLRQVYCEKVIANGVPSVAEDAECERLVGPKPEAKEACNEEVECPQWHVGPWKPCDHLCGEGQSRRKVQCFIKKDGKIAVLDDAACTDKPEDSKECMLRPCEGVDWVTSEWSGCADKCDLTQETRKAYCSNQAGKVYPDEQCQQKRLPELVRNCETGGEACEFQWYAGQWSKCSAVCGDGVRTRKVFCGSPDADDNIKKVGDEKCEAADKYEASKNCTAAVECSGEWFSGPWTGCSKVCGGGVMARKVICLLNNATVDAKSCNPSTTPFSSEPCNNHQCSEDQIVPMEPEPEKVTVSEEEECEEDEEDGSVITMDTTLSLDDMTVTTLSSATDLGGSKDTDASSSSGMAEDFLLSTTSDADSSSASSSASMATSSTDAQTDLSSPSSDKSTTSSDLSSSSSDLSSASSDLSSASSDPSTSSSSISDDMLSGSTGGTSDSDSPLTTLSAPADQTLSTTDALSLSEGSSSDATASSDSSSSDSSSSVDASSSTDSSPTSESSTDASTDVESSSSSDASSSSDSSSTSDSTSPSEETTTYMSSSSDATETTSESSTDTTMSDASSESTSSGSDASSVTTDAVTTATEEEFHIGEVDSPTDINKPIETSSEPTGSTVETTGSSDSSSASSDSSSSSDTSESTVESSEGTTESSGSTTDTSEGSTDISKDTTSGSEGTTDSSKSSDGSEGTSESSEGTTDVSEGTTESSEGTTDVSEGTSDVSEGTTSVSDGSSASSDADDWLTLITSSQSPMELAITKEQRMKKCKPKKPKKDCDTSEFGCCPDGATKAKGPFSKDCPMPMTCNDTEHGCCADGVSPAVGPAQEGCPPSDCEETLFGCCQDGKAVAEGNDFEGCVVEKPDLGEDLMPVDCKTSQFGCCPDMILSATGPLNAGCDTCEGSGDCDSCKDTKFGCCPDGNRAASGPENAGCDDDEEGSGFGSTTTAPVLDCTEAEYGCCPDAVKAATGPHFKDCGVIDYENCTLSYYRCCPDGVKPALGPNFEECQMPCAQEAFGCCEDGVSPAHGPNLEGCCLNSPHGCCPDNIVAAQGPNLEGCGCQYGRFGCCPDNTTVARGPNNEGCGCQHTPHGCCQNRYTPAAGPDLQGCPCYTYQFGCCPDGVAIAKGPYNQGCGCENSEFGCCSDDRTPATGPERAGCGCEASKYGCCVDGVTEAQGEKFEGCDTVPVVPGESCTEGKDRGSCRDFTVKWFYDMEYGGCSRFWYGGCEGNNNRFMTQDECKGVCVEPAGAAACHLPKVEGPCEGYYPKWYYDAQRKQCGQFVYGGCLGNNNKFETIEECQGLCVKPETADACDQPKKEGPCEGNFTRWHFDAETKVCQQFTYGGCKANQNNFAAESACVQKCLQPGRSRDMCSLPREVGKCGERLPKWFFDAAENRCMPFYYTGCEGNANRFDTQEACMSDCPPRVVQDTCTLPALAGDCRNFTERWYYDSHEVRCRQFYYGGCGGNLNNFGSSAECERRCEPGAAPPAPVAPEEPPARPEFDRNSCFLPDERGSCAETQAQWFYDSRDGVCKQFLYGGCEGNANRFATRDDCEQRCGDVQDVCTLPVVVGPCSGSQQQYYYDGRADACFAFDYGGCQGNRNRFNDQRQCEERCRRAPSLTTAGPPPQPPARERPDERVNEVVPSDICRAQVDAGPCTESNPAWYYDEARGACHAFIYGGCGGNANRFESEEQCERQCGNFVGQDVCSIPRDPGQCRGNFRKYYYDQATARCEVFGYGGCGGAGNRFSTVEECQAVCLHKEEPMPRGNDTAVSHLALCRLAVDQGSCPTNSYKRWYYDESQATCVPFIYTGCAGNLNRFKDFETCMAFCTGVPAEPGRPAEPERPSEVEGRPEPEERPENEVDVDGCAAAKDECGRLRCVYGVERFVGADDCDRCRCHDVCRDHYCADGSRCAVERGWNPETSEQEYQAVCRPVSKPGQCPSFTPGSHSCVRECNSDADCNGADKCCLHDCGSSCVSVASEPEAFTTSAPRYDPYNRQGVEPPRITDVDPVVSAEEGNYATLRCVARGFPTPTITWRRETVVIDGSGGRHKLLLNGSLQIIGLIRQDAGSYYCTADNNVGQPALREIRLEVTDPVQKPAAIIGEPNTYVVVNLGVPASLQCYVIGYPRPAVTWWRGNRMLPLTSELFEQRRDFSLLIRSVTLRNLGPYTCQAYNGLGKADSWSITVQSVGPVFTSNPEDQPYVQYLVVQPRRPENETEVVALERQRPSYPYRPVRPAPEAPVAEPEAPVPPPEVPEARAQPDVARETGDGSGDGSGETPRVFLVPVTANITAERTNYPIGGDISIPCAIDGYPIPRVTWYKDDRAVPRNDRIQISESHRLLIKRAESGDGGTYRCEADNQYGSAVSTITISVEGVYIHPNCTDNPFFANCALIVEANYCTHNYYARFCCKSCTRAGQLPSYGPHLGRTGTLDRPASRP